ncbi:MAG: carboxypeptidase-like regulatory domain-containing protein, partial [Jiangellaceae bacterium]
FGTDASVPAMPWKQSRGNVAGALVTDDGAALDQVAVTLTPLTVAGEPVTHVSDGSGWFGFVDLAPGRYLVQADLPDGVVGKPVSVVTVGAGELVEADVAPLISLH